MNDKTVNILDVRFDNTNETKTMEHIAAFLYSGMLHNTIYTPNAEMLVYAAKDNNFRNILNRSSLNLCDGSGPAYMARIFQKQTLERMSGVDGLLHVLKVASESENTVYLLGSGDEVTLANASNAFTKQFPKLRIVQTHPGIDFDLAETNNVHTLVYDEEALTELHNDIIMHAPDILIVGLGHPKQELFIDTFIEEFPSVKIAMGVGGSFDMYGGKVRRAPQVVRNIGLESLWRLVLQPWRWKRVFTALIIFPILYIFNQKSKIRN